MPEINEILVPCPCCRKIHKVSVKEIKENECIKLPCGATIGTIGLMWRIAEAEEKAKKYKPGPYKLEDYKGQ